MCAILTRPRKPNGSVTGTAWTTVSSALCCRLRASARANAVLAALEKSTAQRMRESSITISAPSGKRGGAVGLTLQTKGNADVRFLAPRRRFSARKPNERLGPLRLSPPPPDLYRGKRRTISAFVSDPWNYVCNRDLWKTQRLGHNRSSFQTETARHNVKAPRNAAALRSLFTA
jgi:hypothetical protein